jgi:DNA-binding PadR family transcriptional regulator
MLRDFFLGIMKIHILFHARRNLVYGAELAEELGRHGYQVSPGTLYPVLHGLEKEGLLESQKATVQGKVRRYYQATRQGIEALDEARSRVRELVREVIMEENNLQ